MNALTRSRSVAAHTCRLPVGSLPQADNLGGIILAELLGGFLHRDPADRLIVATCRVLGHPLVTDDRAITRARLVRRWTPEPQP